ncbi:MAG: hypothetical protein AAF664_10195 [Planctomycetota bacterium]
MLPASFIESLQYQLQRRLQIGVECIEGSHPDCPELCVAIPPAISEPAGQYVIDRLDDQRRQVAMRIDDDTYAVWTCGRGVAYASALHAKTVIELHAMMMEELEPAGQAN